MSLQPGDIISTGTPPGVGLGIKPNPIYLKTGQTIRLGIPGSASSSSGRWRRSNRANPAVSRALRCSP